MCHAPQSELTTRSALISHLPTTTESAATAVGEVVAHGGYTVTCDVGGKLTVRKGDKEVAREMYTIYEMMSEQKLPDFPVKQLKKSWPG